MLSTNLDPKINPDLRNIFNSLPFAEIELRAIEHYNVYGRKEGRILIPINHIQK